MADEIVQRECINAGRNHLCNPKCADEPAGPIDPARQAAYAAAQPAAVADQADDVYEAAARLTLAGLAVHDPRPDQITAWTGDSAYRFGVDAGRAALLAGVERMQDLLRDVRTYGNLPRSIRDRITMEVGSG